MLMPANLAMIDPCHITAHPISETRSLLDKWGRLHAVRSVLSLYCVGRLSSVAIWG